MPKINITFQSDEISATASSLLDTAEWLFARDGIENVSIRQIVKESGHGNLSGAHYHFGNRETLIRKLLERRMVVVDALRHAALDRLVELGLERDLYALIECTTRVLETTVREYSWGRDYVLVIAQALFNPRIKLIDSLSINAITGLKRTGELARAELTHLPEDCFKERLRITRLNVVYEVARWLEENELRAATEKAFQQVIVNVSEFSVGGLLAPVRSQESQKPVAKVARSTSVAQARKRSSD